MGVENGPPTSVGSIELESGAGSLSQKMSAMPVNATPSGDELAAIVNDGTNQVVSLKSILNMGTMQALSSIIPGESGSDILIEAGAGLGSGTGATVYMYGGAGGTSGTGGPIFLTGGMGGALSGAGGSVSVTGGVSPTGNGGVLYFAGGGATQGLGGSLNFVGGSGQTGGPINFLPGRSIGGSGNPAPVQFDDDPSLLVIPYRWDPGDSLNGRTVFTAARPLLITAVIARIDTANGTAATVAPVWSQSGEGYESPFGTALTTNSINLAGTGGTNQTLTLTTTPGALQVPAGASVGFVATGTLAASSGCVTIHATPIGTIP